MKGVLYYFSGTGNTKWAADKFKEIFKFYGSEVELFNIEKLDENVEVKGDIIILGTPVYGGMPPKLFSDFLYRLPSGDGKRCFIYSTQGKDTSSASKQVGRIMREKGYLVLMEASIKMPESFYFKNSKHKLEDDTIACIMEEACKKIKELVKCAIMDKQIIEGSSMIKLLMGKMANRNFSSKICSVSRKIKATSSCSKCGLCLRNCPKGNVTFENGQAIFHSNCMMCMRCIHICPINAITYDGRFIKQTQKDIIKNLEII